jgi:hypothetical protein
MQVSPGALFIFNTVGLLLLPLFMVWIFLVAALTYLSTVPSLLIALLCTFIFRSLDWSSIKTACWAAIIATFLPGAIAWLVLSIDSTQDTDVVWTVFAISGLGGLHAFPYAFYIRPKWLGAWFRQAISLFARP